VVPRPAAGWPGRCDRPVPDKPTCRQRTPDVSRGRVPPLRLHSPFKAPGLTVSGFQCFHGPDATLQRDKSAINVRLIVTYCGVACGQYRFSLHAQAAAGALPGKGPVMGAARQRNPQQFHRVHTGLARLRTSHPHVCAQTAGTQPRRSGRPARRTRGSGLDEIAQEGRHRMPTAARKTGRPRIHRKPARPAHPDRPRTARPRYAQAAQAMPLVTPPPALTGAVGRPLTNPADALPGRIRQGPSMYEMEGPCPASPHQARQLPGFAGAARRPPVPDAHARDRLPGSSHVPGVTPKVVPVSNGEGISTASASMRARPCGQ
jgi:hypothetical protein